MGTTLNNSGSSFWKKYECINITWQYQRENGPVQVQNWLFAVISYSFFSILKQYVLKSDIAFLRFGNFIDDVINRFSENPGKVLTSVNSKLRVNFYMKMLFLCQILQATRRKILKIPKLVKSQNWSCDHILKYWCAQIEFSDNVYDTFWYFEDWL